MLLRPYLFALLSFTIVNIIGIPSSTAVAGILCEYNLTASATGTATVRIKSNEIKVTIAGAASHTLYTIWVDFKNRATGQLPDYPADGIARGVAPAFASTAGVTNGIGLDPNGVITDVTGDAIIKNKLDYNLVSASTSPVVGAQLSMQGLNRVGGYWLRTYPVDENTAASLQSTDPTTELPLLQRGTAQGITIVGHYDSITHGHTPGVGGVDHFSAFKGDFPAGCLLP